LEGFLSICLEDDGIHNMSEKWVIELKIRTEKYNIMCKRIEEWKPVRFAGCLPLTYRSEEEATTEMRRRYGSPEPDVRVSLLK